MRRAMVSISEVLRGCSFCGTGEPSEVDVSVAVVGLFPKWALFSSRVLHAHV